MRKLVVLFGLVTIAVLALPASGSARIYTGLTTADQNGNGLGSCSLREAVQAATSNANYGGCLAGDSTLDEIVLDAPEYKIGVASDGTTATNENSNADGDIDVGSGGSGGGPLIIRSNVAGVRRSITMDEQGAGGDDRMLDLRAADVDLRLKDLKLATEEEIPADDGGVIRAQTAGNDLTLGNVEIDGGSATANAQNGGAILAEGAGTNVTIANSEIHSANASSQGGAVLIQGGPSSLTVTNSDIHDNAAIAPAGLDAQGGGLFSDNNTAFTITDSRIVDNMAVAPDLTGGSGRGGGIVSFSPVTIKGSLLSGNSALSNKTSGADEPGGALYLVNNNPSTIRNTTLFDNAAGNAGGDNSRGGAIYDGANGALTIDHDTFLGNVASNASGGDDVRNDGAGTLTYTASILPGGVGLNPCVGGNFASGGSNVVDSTETECGPNGTTDRTGPAGFSQAAPSSNGGPTPTLAIGTGGAAFDIESAASCATSSEGVDQRGLSRPQGAACDAGAFERCATPGGSMPECPALPAANTPPGNPASSTNPAGKTRKRKCKKKKRHAATAKKKKCKRKKK